MRGEEIFKDFNIIEVKFPETSEYNWLGRTSIYSQPKKASVRRRTPRRYTKKVVTNCDAACCKNRMERYEFKINRILNILNNFFFQF